MIERSDDKLLLIECENGSELEIEKYIQEPSRRLNHKDAKLYITINECETSILNKEDALAVVNKILEFLNEN